MGLTAERLREKLEYDPATGLWRKRRYIGSRGRKCGGHIVGCKKEGYNVIGINYVIYRAPRLAFLYMTGEWPKGEVDHKNTIRDDDRWENLRDVTQGLNNSNRHIYSNNKLRLKGVTFDRIRTRYRAQITVAGKVRTVGYSNCPAVASFMYQVEAHKAFGNNHRVA